MIYPLLGGTKDIHSSQRIVLFCSIYLCVSTQQHGISYYLLFGMLYFDMFRIVTTYHQETTICLGAHCKSAKLKYKIHHYTG
jgi:hypothetical protein